MQKEVCFSLFNNTVNRIFWGGGVMLVKIRHLLQLLCTESQEAFILLFSDILERLSILLTTDFIDNENIVLFVAALLQI